MTRFHAFATLYWADYLVTALGLAAGLGRELNPFVPADDLGSLFTFKLLGFLAFSAGLQFLRPRLRVWPITIATTVYTLILLWNLAQVVVAMVML